MTEGIQPEIRPDRQAAKDGRGSLLIGQDGYTQTTEQTLPSPLSKANGPDTNRHLLAIVEDDQAASERRRRARELKAKIESNKGNIVSPTPESKKVLHQPLRGIEYTPRENRSSDSETNSG